MVDPQNVCTDQWQALFEVYINNQYNLQIKDWFEQNNAEALAQVSERMLEAIRKGYWQPDDETVKKLLATLQEISARYDVQTLNQKIKAFVAGQAAGYGLTAPKAMPVSPPPVNIPQPAPTPTNQATQTTQPVEGQKLEKVAPQPSEAMQKHTRYLLLALMLLILLAGAAWQYWRAGRSVSRT